MTQSRTIGWLVLSSMLVAGCATVATRRVEKQGTATEVASLESQIAQLTQRLNELAQGQQTLSQEVGTLKTAQAPTTNVRPATKPTLPVREIQQALAKAGFYKGAIDGKEGPQTKQAIIEFQKAHGLTADGKVGIKTSAALSKYLE